MRFYFNELGRIGRERLFGSQHGFIGSLVVVGWIVFALVRITLVSRHVIHRTIRVDCGQQRHAQSSLRQTVLATLAITLLNPHVYIDTVMLVGGVAASLSLEQKIGF